MPSFKSLIFLTFACLVLGLSSACTDQSAPSQYNHPDIQPEDLQGTWSLSHGTVMDIPDFMPGGRAVTEWSPYGLNWDPIQLCFRGDSMDIFSYPLGYSGSYAFEVRGNQLAVRSEGWESGTWVWGEKAIHLERDSLLRSGRALGYWMTGHYYRDTLDEDTLAMLRRDSVNIGALPGTWRLDSTVSVDYDADYTIDLPFDIPDSLVFRSNDIRNIKGRVISVRVNSSPRPFRFGYVSKHRIWIKPVGWFKEGLPPIQYDRDYFLSLLDYNDIHRVEDVKRMEIAYAEDIGALLGDEDSARTVKTTEKPAEISKFIDLLRQLSHKGTGKEYRYRRDNLPSWRIRFVDHEDLWHNVLFIGKHIDTPVGTPGEYYVDQKNLALEAELYALMKAFWADAE